MKNKFTLFLRQSALIVMLAAVFGSRALSAEMIYAALEDVLRSEELSIDAAARRIDNDAGIMSVERSPGIAAERIMNPMAVMAAATPDQWWVKPNPNGFIYNDDVPLEYKFDLQPKGYGYGNYAIYAREYTQSVIGGAVKVRDFVNTPYNFTNADMPCFGVYLDRPGVYGFQYTYNGSTKSEIFWVVLVDTEPLKTYYQALPADVMYSYNNEDGRFSDDSWKRFIDAKAGANKAFLKWDLPQDPERTGNLGTTQAVINAALAELKAAYEGLKPQPKEVSFSVNPSYFDIARKVPNASYVSFSNATIVPASQAKDAIYAWSLTSKPSGAAAWNKSGKTPDSYTPTVVGSYTFQLKVTTKTGYVITADSIVIVVNKQELSDAVDDADRLYSQGSSNYDASLWGQMQNSRLAAKSVLASTNKATTQDIINAAKNDLLQKLANLRKGVKSVAIEYTPASRYVDLSSNNADERCITIKKVTVTPSTAAATASYSWSLSRRPAAATQWASTLEKPVYNPPAKGTYDISLATSSNGGEPVVNTTVSDFTVVDKSRLRSLTDRALIIYASGSSGYDANLWIKMVEAMAVALDARDARDLNTASQAKIDEAADALEKALNSLTTGVNAVTFDVRPAYVDMHGGTASSAVSFLNIYVTPQSAAANASYTWSLTDKPSGAANWNATTATPGSFTPDRTGGYTVMLSVTGGGTTTPATFKRRIIAVDKKPMLDSLQKILDMGTVNPGYNADIWQVLNEARSGALNIKAANDSVSGSQAKINEATAAIHIALDKARRDVRSVSFAVLPVSKYVDLSNPTLSERYFTISNISVAPALAAQSASYAWTPSDAVWTPDASSKTVSRATFNSPGTYELKLSVTGSSSYAKVFTVGNCVVVNKGNLRAAYAEAMALGQDNQGYDAKLWSTMTIVRSQAGNLLNPGDVSQQDQIDTMYDLLRAALDALGRTPGTVTFKAEPKYIDLNGGTTTSTSVTFSDVKIVPATFTPVYRWSLLQSPDGAPHWTSDLNEPSPFSPAVTGKYIIKLEVSDQGGSSTTISSTAEITVVDKKALKDSIGTANLLLGNTADYVSALAGELDAAKSDANTVFGNNSVEQAGIDNAVAALHTALDNLRRGVKEITFSAATKYVDLSNPDASKTYVSISNVRVIPATAAATAAYTWKPTGSDFVWVPGATASVPTRLTIKSVGIHNITAKAEGSSGTADEYTVSSILVVNKKDLRDSIDKAQEIIDMGKSGNGGYSQEQLDKLEDKLNKAKDVLNDETQNNTQSKIDEAASDLGNAMNSVKNGIGSVSFKVSPAYFDLSSTAPKATVITMSDVRVTPASAAAGATYDWSLANKPSGANNWTASGTSNITLSPKAGVKGTYRIQLKVTDAGNSYVTSEQSVTVVDKSALRDTLATIVGLNSANYNSSLWDALYELGNDAKVELDRNNGPSQDNLNTIVAGLHNALDNLRKGVLSISFTTMVNNDANCKYIDISSTVEAERYIIIKDVTVLPASAEATAIYTWTPADNNGITWTYPGGSLHPTKLSIQTPGIYSIWVNATGSANSNDDHRIKDFVVVNKAGLRNQIASAESKVNAGQGQYNENAWNAMLAAKQKAEEVRDSKNASNTQQEIEAAAKALKDAMDALDTNASSISFSAIPDYVDLHGGTTSTKVTLSNVVITPVTAQISKYSWSFSPTDASVLENSTGSSADFTPVSTGEYKIKLEVENNSGEQISNEKAITVVDKKPLREVLDSVYSLNSNDYDPILWRAVQTIVPDAEVAAARDAKSSQATLDRYTNDLRNAMYGMKKVVKGISFEIAPAYIDISDANYDKRYFTISNVRVTPESAQETATYTWTPSAGSTVEWTKTNTTDMFPAKLVFIQNGSLEMGSKTVQVEARGTSGSSVFSNPATVYIVDKKALRDSIQTAERIISDNSVEYNDNLVDALENALDFADVVNIATTIKEGSKEDIQKAIADLHEAMENIRNSKVEGVTFVAAPTYVDLSGATTATEVEFSRVVVTPLSAEANASYKWELTAKPDGYNHPWEPRVRNPRPLRSLVTGNYTVKLTVTGGITVSNEVNITVVDKTDLINSITEASIYGSVNTLYEPALWANMNDSLSAARSIKDSQASQNAIDVAQKSLDSAVERMLKGVRSVSFKASPYVDLSKRTLGAAQQIVLSEVTVIPSNAAVTYAWSLKSKPEDVDWSSNTRTPEPFLPSKVGIYVIELAVAGGSGTEAKAEQRVTVVSKDRLMDAIGKAEGLTSSGYDRSLWDNMLRYKEEAKALISATPDQQAIDRACDNLLEAIANLKNGIGALQFTIAPTAYLDLSDITDSLVTVTSVSITPIDALIGASFQWSATPSTVEWKPSDAEQKPKVKFLSTGNYTLRLRATGANSIPANASTVIMVVNKRALRDTLNTANTFANAGYNPTLYSEMVTAKSAAEAELNNRTHSQIDIDKVVDDLHIALDRLRTGLKSIRFKPSPESYIDLSDPDPTKRYVTISDVKVIPAAAPVSCVWSAAPTSVTWAPSNLEPEKVVFNVPNNYTITVDATGLYGTSHRHSSGSIMVVDKSNLRTACTEADAYGDTNGGRFDDDLWTAMVEARDIARSMIVSTNPSYATQPEIITATNNLNEALAKLLGGLTDAGFSTSPDNYVDISEPLTADSVLNVTSVRIRPASAEATATYAWTVAPNTVTWSGTNRKIPSKLSFKAAGDYTIKLTATGSSVSADSSKTVTVVNKRALRDAMADAKSLEKDRDQYDDALWQKVSDAMDDAQKAIDAKNNTDGSQDKVDNALASLTDAVDKLGAGIHKVVISAAPLYIDLSGKTTKHRAVWFSTPTVTPAAAAAVARYAWMLKRYPAASTAGKWGASVAVPDSLKPDITGTYVIALTASTTAPVSRATDSVAVTVVDKTPLFDAIDRAESLGNNDDGKYPASEWAAVDAARKEAEAAVNNQVEQDEIDRVADNLDDAVDALDEAVESPEHKQSIREVTFKATPLYIDISEPVVANRRVEFSDVVVTPATATDARFFWSVVTPPNSKVSWSASTKIPESFQPDSTGNYVVSLIARGSGTSRASHTETIAVVNKQALRDILDELIGLGDNSTGKYPPAAWDIVEEARDSVENVINRQSSQDDIDKTVKWAGDVLDAVVDIPVNRQSVTRVTFKATPLYIDLSDSVPANLQTVFSDVKVRPVTATGVTFKWKLVTKPDVSRLEWGFTGKDADPLKPDSVGQYTVMLTAYSTVGDSAYSSKTITVVKTPAKPVVPPVVPPTGLDELSFKTSTHYIDVSDPVVANRSAVFSDVVVKRAGSEDPADFRYRWSYTTDSKSNLRWGFSVKDARPLRPDSIGNYTVTLSVKDASGDSLSHSESIMVVDKKALHDIIEEIDSMGDNSDGKYTVDQWDSIQDVKDEVEDAIKDSTITQEQIEDAAKEAGKIIDDILEHPVDPQMLTEARFTPSTRTVDLSDPALANRKVAFTDVLVRPATAKGVTYRWTVDKPTTSGITWGFTIKEADPLKPDSTGYYTVTFTARNSDKDSVGHSETIMVVNKQALRDILDEINNMGDNDNGKYTPEQWDSIQDVKDGLENAIDNPDLKQDEIDKIADSSRETIDEIAEKPTNPEYVTQVLFTATPTYVDISDPVTANRTVRFYDVRMRPTSAKRLAYLWTVEKPVNSRIKWGGDTTVEVPDMIPDIVGSYYVKLKLTGSLNDSVFHIEEIIAVNKQPLRDAQKDLDALGDNSNGRYPSTVWNDVENARKQIDNAMADGTITQDEIDALAKKANDARDAAEASAVANPEAVTSVRFNASPLYIDISDPVPANLSTVVTSVEVLPASAAASADYLWLAVNKPIVSKVVWSYKTRMPEPFTPDSVGSYTLLLTVIGKNGTPMMADTIVTVVNKQSLRDIINRIDSLGDNSDGLYTPEQWDSIQDARDKAKDMLDDTTVGQDSINNVADEINDDMRDIVPGWDDINTEPTPGPEPVEENWRFEDFTRQKFGNTFVFNKLRLRQQGYTWIDCRWYENDILVGQGPSYSVGETREERFHDGSTYYFIVVTAEGEFRSTDYVHKVQPSLTTKAWPNPTTDRVIVSLDGWHEGDIIGVYNMNGSMVKSLTVSSAEMEINLDAQTPGTYVIKHIRRSGQQSTVKVVKQ